MSGWYEDNSQSIGHTPLVRLNRVIDGAPATVLAKSRGAIPPTPSNAASAPRWCGTPRSAGLLGPGKELVEPTSGNTGIALAFVAAARNIPLTLTMPDTMSMERRKLLIAYGAKLVLTEGARGMSGAIAKAEEIVASAPEHYVLLQQFKNPANPAIHETTTGPEIWNDTEGAIDIFVSGVGTGGTITGVSRYIKNTKGKEDHFGRGRAGREPGSHAAARGPTAEAVARTRFRASARDSCPKSRSLDWSTRSSRSPTRRRSTMRGGSRARKVSCRASLPAPPSRSPRASPSARENAGKTIVAILPDSGERYLSTTLFEGVVRRQEASRMKSATTNGASTAPARALGPRSHRRRVARARGSRQGRKRKARHEMPVARGAARTSSTDSSRCSFRPTSGCPI